jgi:hypothetical protein
MAKISNMNVEQLKSYLNANERKQFSVLAQDLGITDKEIRDLTTDWAFGDTEALETDLKNLKEKYK